MRVYVGEGTRGRPYVHPGGCDINGNISSNVQAIHADSENNALIANPVDTTVNLMPSAFSTFNPSIREQRHAQNMGNHPGGASMLPGARHMEQRTRDAERQVLENRAMDNSFNISDYSTDGHQFDQAGCCMVAQKFHPRTKGIPNQPLPPFISRYLRVLGIHKVEMDEEILAKSGAGRLKTMNVMLRVAGVRKLIERGNDDGEYLLRFDNIYDAIEAFFELRALNRWGVEFIPDIQFHNQGGIETPNWTVNETVLMICVFHRNQNGWVPTMKIAHLLQYTRTELFRLLEEEFGVDCVFELTEEAFGENHVAFKVSFASVTIADRVARRWVDGFAAFSQLPNQTELVAFSRYWETRQDPTLFLNRNGKARGTRHHGNPTPGNMVDPEMIRRGLDHRTTIMLRNIPNKLQLRELIRLLNAYCEGLFDFCYLRVDFGNRCNVGYAFINFVEPGNILPFHAAFSNVKWNIYNSDKVAQICYATIQGRECLVERFRNSGVMFQWGPFRAKLYRTLADPEVIMNPHLVSEEAPFPAPNNRVKLQRSLDNAYHVGLYPPQPNSKSWRRQIEDHEELRLLDNRDLSARFGSAPDLTNTTGPMISASANGMVHSSSLPMMGPVHIVMHPMFVPQPGMVVPYGPPPGPIRLPPPMALPAPIAPPGPIAPPSRRHRGGQISSSTHRTTPQ